MDGVEGRGRGKGKGEGERVLLVGKRQLEPTGFDLPRWPGVVLA